MLDRLAAKLDINRIALRRKNLIRAGDSVTTGQIIPIVTAHECLDAVLERYQAAPLPIPFSNGAIAMHGGNGEQSAIANLKSQIGNLESEIGNRKSEIGNRKSQGSHYLG
jgi:CO/xanthine dehydrogenase Mo-binding subunit